MDNKVETAYNVREEVAKRINLLLKSNNMTQKALADKCGLATAIINKASKGDLSIKSALIISKALGVSLDYLYGMSEEENCNQYALEILLKHFRVLEEKSYWNGGLMEVHISISRELGALLDTITNLMEAKIDDDLRREGVQRAKVAFLQTIDNPPGEPRKYVLLDPNFYTDEVRAAVEKVKENMGGELRN